MGQRETVNAQIVGTFLGYEDHGIPTCQIKLTWGSCGQSFGGYDLRHYGVDMIMQIMRVVGVESWDQLKGRYCRIVQEHTKIHAIGHICENKWYWPEGEET